jgi:putative PIG3 family NAD(P)H quinone oxidoreductase
MDLPDVMTAIEISQPGDPEVLVPVTRPVPKPGPNELLVRVAAAGVNRPDVLQRRGLYPPPPGASDIPGLEVAGEVVAAGEGATHHIGSRVTALIAGGGYAEYAIAPLATSLPVTEGLSLTEAAALPETLFTVWVNLFERGFASEGDWVLVHGGTSGIGTMAITLCRLLGVKIIVTCGSEEKCAAALGLGATAAINYRTQDFAEEVKRLTGGAGANVILDMVGGDYLPRNLACLAEDGRHVSIATQRGVAAELNLLDVMRRRLTLTGSTLRPRSTAFKGMVAEELRREIWPFVESGQLRPTVDRTYPLTQAADAHARMEAGEHVGKIVLTTDIGLERPRS